MKKIIIATALILASGILPSCTKQAASPSTATLEHSTVSSKKDLGTAD
jgi:hypothetical protein